MTQLEMVQRSVKEINIRNTRNAKEVKISEKKMLVVVLPLIRNLSVKDFKCHHVYKKTLI